MNPTRELHRAHSKLERCIADVARLEAATRGLPEAVVTEWIAVAASHGYDSDGDSVVQIHVLVPTGNGGTPFHRLLGLIDYARTRMRNAILRDDQ